MPSRVRIMQPASVRTACTETAVSRRLLRSMTITVFAIAVASVSVVVRGCGAVRTRHFRDNSLYLFCGDGVNPLTSPFQSFEQLHQLFDIDRFVDESLAAQKEGLFLREDIV